MALKKLELHLDSNHEINKKSDNITKEENIGIYKPIQAKAHTPPYKIHRYFARRPWNVFEQLIKAYSDKSDIILDPFCGGGVTIYEGLKNQRKVIGFDLNPLSIFIIRNMIRKYPDISHLENYYQQLLDYLDYLYSDFTKINLESSQKTLKSNSVLESWNELTYEVKCNLCNKKTILSNENKIQNGRYSCENKNCPGNKNNGGYIEPKNCKRIGHIYLYSVVKSPITNKYISIKFGKKRQQKLVNHIEFLKREIKKNNIDIPSDKIPLNWDRQHEDLLQKKGIINFQDFFTERNLLINLLLLNKIKKIDANNKIKDLLRITFSSSLRDTNIMSFTSKGWQSGKPITWSKHAYWIPSQFCEVNVKNAFQKACIRLKTSLTHNSNFSYEIKKVEKFKDLDKGNILLKSMSLEDSLIPDESVDLIITDPPYGSNVQYLELSNFWYPWNRDIYNEKEINFEKEAVSNRKNNFKGSKGLKEYENNLFSVFKRCYSVLKPNGLMILTFNNKDIGAWLALMLSIFRAGFNFKKNGLFFQSGVKNYKQTAHTKYKGSPYGDFIYIFYKPKDGKDGFLKSEMQEEKFIKELDKKFIYHLEDFKLNGKNKNEIIKNMILDVIPLIYEFANNLSKDGGHSLYEKYKKNHLEKIYSGKYDKKK